MEQEALIQYYNRLNGRSISLEKLKNFRERIQAALDSNGHGTYTIDLKGMLARVATAIKTMIAEGADIADRIEMIPIEIKRQDGKILRVASGYQEKEVKTVVEKPDNVVAEEIRIRDIHTDTKRFQNRMDAFSEASANSVAENYDPNKFDPIVVWMDPKAKKLFVLSGHSRYEGMKRRGSKTIPVRYFKGSEEEAIRFAKVEANRAANQESLIEDLAAYRLMRDGDESKSIKKLSKSELGKIFKGKVQKLEAYSFLAPGGLFVNALNQGTTSNYPYLERNAQWIGQLRKENTVISNAGEDNIFHFFYSDKSGRNLKLSKDEFFKLAAKKIAQLGRGEGVLFPECSADGCMKVADKETDPIKGESYKRLREISEQLTSIREKLSSRDPRIRVTTEEEKKYLRDTAAKLESEKEKIQRDLDVMDKSQASLFGLPDYKIRKAYFRGNKKYGRTTQLLDADGIVLLEVMGVASKKDLVRQFEKGGLGDIAKEEPLRTKQLRAMFARLANGAPDKQPKKTAQDKTPAPPPVPSKKDKRNQFAPKSRGKKPPVKPSYANDINQETARRAYYWTSFSPEKRGDGFRTEYSQILTEFREKIKPRADKMGMSEEFEMDFAKYRDRMKTLANAYLRSHSNVASSMITGPSKFPVERNRKNGAIADKRLQEYFDYDEYMRKELIKKYTPDEFKPVKTGQANALEILQKKLANLERAHKTMVESNKIIRSKKSDEEKVLAMQEVGLTEKQAREMLQPDYAGRIGFAAYVLTNNNAEIKRLKDRITDVEKLHAKREGGNKKTTYGNGHVLENYDEDRLQLIFDGKPSESIRNTLKKHGFKWSPKHMAWQRQLTNNAKWVLKQIKDEVFTPEQVSGPQVDAFPDVQVVPKQKGPLNRLQMKQLQEAIAAGRTPKVNLKAKVNAKAKPAPLFDEPVNNPRQASLFGSDSTQGRSREKLTRMFLFEKPHALEYHTLGKDRQRWKADKPVLDQLIKERLIKVASKTRNRILYVWIGPEEQTSLKGATNGPKGPKRATHLSGVVDSSELTKVRYKRMQLTGKYRQDFEALNSDTQVMIWGIPGSGKTVYLLEFAQYLASTGLNVLYVANEEYGRSTLAEKISQFKIGHARLKFSKHVTEHLIDQFDAVFFDSINSMGLDLEDYRSLKDKFPGKIFVLIIQSTKDGDFRGGKDWEHEVDIAGEVVNRKLILRKNRLDPENSAKAEKLLEKELISEAMKKKKIRDAVQGATGKIATQPT